MEDEAKKREREIGDDEEKEWRECVWREETLTRETQSGGLGRLSVSVAPFISWTPSLSWMLALPVSLSLAVALDSHMHAAMQPLQQH